MVDLRGRTRLDASPVLAKMKEYAGRTHWVYADNQVYTFHLQLPMPPELAMVSLKRFWSDQITTREVVETCRHYRTEQLLLNPAKIGPEWDDFLNADYSMVYQDKDSVLYAAKRIQAK